MDGRFIHLPISTLETMLTKWTAALEAIAVGNQSYSIAGRSFSRANLGEVSEMVGEISYALELARGNLSRWTHANFQSGP